MNSNTRSGRGPTGTAVVGVRGGCDDDDGVGMVDEEIVAAVDAEEKEGVCGEESTVGLSAVTSMATVGMMIVLTPSIVISVAAVDIVFPLVLFPDVVSLVDFITSSSSGGNRRLSVVIVVVTLTTRAECPRVAASDDNAYCVTSIGSGDRNTYRGEVRSLVDGGDKRDKSAIEEEDDDPSMGDVLLIPPSSSSSSFIPPSAVRVIESVRMVDSTCGPTVSEGRGRDVGIGSTIVVSTTIDGGEDDMMVVYN